MFTAKHLEKQSTKTIPDSEPPFVPQSPPLFYSGFCAITQTTLVKAPATPVFPDLLVLFDPTDSPCLLGLLSPPVSPDLAFLPWMLLISWLASSSPPLPTLRPCSVPCSVGLLLFSLGDRSYSHNFIPTLPSTWWWLSNVYFWPKHLWAPDLNIQLSISFYLSVRLHHPPSLKHGSVSLFFFSPLLHT